MAYPLKTKPVFKQYIWGGSALRDRFGKDIPDGFAAESWEISCHEDGPCQVANGPYAGMLLEDVLNSHQAEMLGGKRYETFPLLVKLLDANQDLSVQVHPDDAYAKEHENGSLGKTEMWYVVDAKPGAKLVYGLKPGTTREGFRMAIENGTLEEVLHYVPVKKGDTFFIPAGTLHAICGGLLIAEIQQSSNTTYRVYDYNRRDKDGKLRPLHVEKAVDVTNLHPVTESGYVPPVTKDGNTVTVLASCPYFETVKYEIASCAQMAARGAFELLVFTEGNGSIAYDGGEEAFRSGDSFFIPATLGDYTIHGACDVLRTYIPEQQEAK